MRSRIMNTPAEKILIYGFTGEDMEKFRGVSKRMKVELSVLPPESAGEQVGYLAGFAGFSPKANVGERAADSRQCVIFFMDGKKLSRTIDDMRANGLGGIPLKAALTAANSKMSLSELMDELEKEHKLMHKEGKENV